MTKRLIIPLAEKNKIISIINKLNLLIIFILISSCLDIIRDERINIVGNLYYIKLDGSNMAGLGQEFSRGNYEILLQGNFAEIEGGKHLLLVKLAPEPNSNVTDTVFCALNINNPRVVVDTLDGDEYYNVLNSLSVNIRLVQTNDNSLLFISQ